MTNHNRTIDFIKGLCIVFICSTHFCFTSEQRSFVLFPLVIDMAVPMLMIVIGYNYSNSYLRRGIDDFIDAYRIQILIRRMLRLLCPFIVFMVFEYILQRFIYRDYSLKVLAESIFPVGGIGAGSYFIPVAIQTVFIYPFIYLVIKRKKLFGLIIVLLVNVIYEYCCVVYGMGEPCYRLLCFRYCTFLGVGTFVSMILRDNNQEEQDRTIRIGGIWKKIILVGGAIIVLLVHDGSISLKYVNRTWSGTSYIASFYLFPIACFALRRNMHGKATILIEYIGRASYNIFLAQMIYYIHFADIVYSVFNSRVLAFLFGVLICLIIGCLFYEADRHFIRAVIRRIETCLTFDDSLENKINKMIKYIK